jgi:hypothetical protein
MPISRMQMPRQLRKGGGIMNVAPRQGYFLGGVGDAIKGTVKGITGGIKKVAKGIVSTVKENPMLALAALNFAPMLAGAKPFIGMGSLAGSKYTLPGITSLFSKKAGEATLGKTLGMFAAGSLLGGVLGQAEETGDPEGITRNVGALRTKLADAYRNQRTFADAKDEEAAIAQQVERDVSEYTAGSGYTNVQESGSFASGGRVQYGLGSLVRGSGVVSASMNEGDTPVMSGSGMGGMIAKLISSDPNILRKLKSNNSSSYSDFIDENFNGIDDRKEAAMGGRMKYALGTPEQNAFKAARLEGLPLNQNPAGVSELDLRESGGFIPPVGVKEKADDIPAMLSNNEFVFTADAVRNMGDGNVNKGAQRMYDFMKYLENGGRV